jgi:hypothetical protein
MIKTCKSAIPQDGYFEGHNAFKEAKVPEDAVIR